LDEVYSPYRTGLGQLLRSPQLLRNIAIALGLGLPGAKNGWAGGSGLRSGKLPDKSEIYADNRDTSLAKPVLTC
jgi:hypothetical protein